MIHWFKKYFIPHQKNDHHPHFWKKGPIFLLLAIVLIVELGVMMQPFLILNKESFLSAVLPGVLTSMTNDMRVINNANSLSVSPVLSEAARLKAEDMAQKGYFAHNTPEGYLPWYWLTKVGYNYAHAGENLAVNFYDSKDVVDAWMNSPTHRANIVKQTYTETGIGMAQGVYQGRSTIFVVQFFGTPAIASVSVPAATSSAVVKKRKPVVTATTTVSVVTASTTKDIPQVAGAQSDQKTSAIETLATSPRHVGNYTLTILLFLVLAALLLAVFVNIKIQHPRIIILGVIIIMIIAGLITFNDKSLNNVMIGGNQANSFMSV